MYFALGIIAIALKIIFKILTLATYLFAGTLAVFVLIVLFANLIERSSEKRWENKEEKKDKSDKK